MPKEKFADLHLHTYYSDGTFSPQQLIAEALNQNISCIAITDHDSVEALPIALSQKSADLEIIPGIELSCDYNGREIHILGYFIDYQNKELLKQLEIIREQRLERIGLMVEKLREMGIDITADEVFKLSGFGVVGRLHLARILLEKKAITNIREAFIKFIGEDCPAYVSRFRLSVQEAINIILDCKGVPVLAHPYTYGNEEFIVNLAGFGLKGIEVYYPEHSASRTERYKVLAERLGLVMTGGSDCHGDLKEDIKVGSVRISYELVERLRNAR
jgi:predicted metal-dependent phosphoesterase TrpH